MVSLWREQNEYLSGIKALRGGSLCSVQFWLLSVLEANVQNNCCNIHLQYSTNRLSTNGSFAIRWLSSFCCCGQPLCPMLKTGKWLIYHLNKTQLFGTWRKIVFVPSCHSCYDVSRWSICHQFAETFQQKWLLSKSLAAMHSTWRKMIDESKTENFAVEDRLRS